MKIPEKREMTVPPIYGLSAHVFRAQYTFKMRNRSSSIQDQNIDLHCVTYNKHVHVYEVYILSYALLCLAMAFVLIFLIYISL